MELSRDLIEVLRPVAEAAHRVVRRLDATEVPPRLRPVARSSGLPPPLLRSLLHELDTNQWFREKVSAEWEDSHLSPPGELFLDRPEGWEGDLKAHTLGLIGERAARRQADLESELDRVKAERDELAGIVAETEEATQRKVEEAVTTIKHDLRGARLATQKANQEAERAIADNERLNLDFRRLSEEADALRSSLDQARRARRRQPPTTRSPAVAGVPHRAEDLASLLDRIQEAGRVQALVASPDTSPPAPEISLPFGVRPDAMEAVSALLPTARHWAVDGYNVAFKLAGAKPDADTRVRVEALLERLARRGRSGVSVTVFWDTDRDVNARGKEVSARYVASADDALIEMAAPGVVVVSSDRYVREGAEARGAVALWAEALVAWSETR